MDLISGLKSELFRPLVTLAIPGSIATAPFVLLALGRVTELAAFRDTQPSMFVVILAMTVLAVGLVLEDVGARVETLWDWRLKRKNAAFDAEWHAYLALSTQDEIVGQRYLRSVVTRMKFELATGPALLAHVVGLNWANVRLGFLTLSQIWIASLGLLVLSAYLLFESYSSASVLMKVRRDIVGASSKQRAAFE